MAGEMWSKLDCMGEMKGNLKLSAVPMSLGQNLMCK